MSGLAKALDEYLALRGALGFDIAQMTRLLPRFVRFVQHEGSTYITTDLSLKWAQEDPAASSVVHSSRLSVVRSFAAWRQVEDPQTEIPPTGLLLRRYQRPTPYIYSEEEIQLIVRCAATLPSKSGLCGLTCSTVFGLIAVTGMRSGEVAALDREDVDLQAGVLAVRGKGGRSRFVPIHASTIDALEDYARKRDALLPDARTPAFFVAERGGRMTARAAGGYFCKVSRMIGLRPPGQRDRRGRGPRLHDMRHRFAVSTLIGWYRLGADVDREIPKLATYLGHKKLKHLYWYLEAVPELLELAMARSRQAASGGAS